MRARDNDDALHAMLASCWLFPSLNARPLCSGRGPPGSDGDPTLAAAPAAAAHRDTAAAPTAAAHRDAAAAAWIEAAQERWRDRRDGGGSREPMTAIGVDVAQGGSG
jgi:hypothetical protein